MVKKYTLLFPGQGSQYAGMGKSLFEVDDIKDYFLQADDILSFPLSKIMLEGNEHELKKTAIAQPAILLHSIAAFKYIQSRVDIKINCALGHSLGEYSALVASLVMDFASAIKAVHLRGKLMQEAVPEGMGAMAAVIGMKAEQVIEAMKEFINEDSETYASCANFNGPLQTVIAGSRLGVMKAQEKLKSLGAKRVIELPVSAPFHCALMKPVQQKMQLVLDDIHFSNASFPIISNISAQKETDGTVIKSLMLQQIANPVRFTHCVSYIEDNNLYEDGYLELGPKNSLCGIIKKINRDSITANVDDVADISKIL